MRKQILQLRKTFVTPNSVGVLVFSVPPVFRRLLKIRSWIFFSFGVRCSGVPKTPKNQILDFLHSPSWCSDVAFLIVGYRSGAPLVFQRPLNFPFQIFFSGSVRCSGVPKTPKFQTSDFRLFLFGVRPTELGVQRLAGGRTHAWPTEMIWGLART